MPVWALCLAGYWVLLAWWVYLDATWRRMEATPWAILTLVTNVVGLVTYLVIRYPEPHTCEHCGANLQMGLKRCPYCGSETELACPRCQAPIRADWLYCPACAAQLPKAQPSSQPAEAPISQPTSRPAVSIMGTVTDAATGLPIAEAQVRIDSKTDTASTAADSQGKFALTDLEPRPYVVLASAEGYAPATRGFTPSATGGGKLDFSLYPLGDAETH
jgi:RNA polymerase subunit RPABC4/transcription elongation factor Spt4